MPTMSNCNISSAVAEVFLRARRQWPSDFVVVSSTPSPANPQAPSENQQDVATSATGSHNSCYVNSTDGGKC